MECTVHFFLLNDDYSPEHAEANGVEESAINRKYEWQDELKITTDVLDVTEHPKAVFPLKGQLDNGEEFSHEIEDMHLFELSGSSPVYVGCSESLLDSFEVEKDDEIIRLKIFLKDYEPLSNPIPGIYITTGAFPKELIF
ncbi:MAG: hypothetical protein ACI837_003325 [Crocinitomicaceae bacterium]|jgi:hypothetical protein